MNKEFEKMWKRFNALSRLFLGGTDKNHEEPQ
jgi:hypothetical protein